MPDNHEHKTPPPTAKDRAALARCDECWSDGQGVDIGRAALDRLADLGWIEKCGRARWEISEQGAAVLRHMEAPVT